MSKQTPKSEIKLNDYMKIIEDHARVGHQYLKHPAIDSVDDLTQEGVVVFFKVLNNCYSENGAASFKSLLIRSLRNHMQTLMRKSFHQLMGCDIKAQEYPANHPMRRYAERRSESMSKFDNGLTLESRENIAQIMGKLDDRDIRYVNLVMEIGRKHAREQLKISKVTERNLRKRIQGKCREFVNME